jgi:dTDP-glucose 4,6-dehydratase
MIGNRVLVTGGCGFIGAFFVRHMLRHCPATELVLSYDKITSCSKPDPFAATPEDARVGSDRHVLVRGDVCDSAKVLQTLQDYAIDTVVHFAAETHVDRSFSSSLEFTKTNVLGTHVLLQCALEYGKIAKFVHISTDEVYGETPDDAEPFAESAPLNPTNPYAATKVAAEALVRSYVSSFALPCVIVRSNNIYGPEQYVDKVIPKFICRLMRGLPLQIHGDGSARRSFLYVDDAVTAITLILDKGVPGQIYNIGTDEEIQILDLAQWLGDRYSGTLEFVRDRAFNDRRYFVNSDRLRALGWRPTVGFQEGLVVTYAWYRDHLHALGWDHSLHDGLAAHPTFDYNQHQPDLAS